MNSTFDAIKIRMDMIAFIDELEAVGGDLTTMLLNLPNEQCKVVVTEIDFQTNAYRKIHGFECQQALSIYSKIGYRSDQDSKEAYRRPGLIQVTSNLYNEINPVIERYNDVKNRIVKFHKVLLTQWPNQTVKELWQLSRSMLCLKQLFRVIQSRNVDLSYAGISIVTKPIVKIITKKDALSAIKKKREHIPPLTDVESFIDYLDAKERELKQMDETSYGFRIARKGAPRPVLNIKNNQGSPFQIMASMPVIIFTTDFVSVGMPKPKKQRLRRKDAFINLDPVGGNQIKAIPLNT